MWAGSAPTTPAPAAAKPARARIDWRALPPQILGSLAISAGIILLFLANLFVALGQIQGTPGNVRLLQFLAPGDVAAGGLLLLAIALVTFGPARASAAAAVRPFGADDARMAAGFVAVAVAAAALVRGIVALTIAHQRGAVRFGGLLDALAAVLVAAVAAYWALVEK